MDDKINQSVIVYLSSYPPRKCGIASFTQDLATAMDYIANPKIKSKVIALNDNGNSYSYNGSVISQISDIDNQSYLDAAQKINEDDNIKLVNVQHEFKLFGSDYGDNLIQFLEAVKKPVVTTLHTVLPWPSVHRINIVQSIAKNSEYLNVLTQSAIKILKEDYGIKDKKIVFIPHGIHDIPFQKNGNLKELLGYQDRIILTSFGFLRPGNGVRSSGRGYEYVLEALPEIVKQFPNVLYLIIGVTHPKILKKEGEKYREFLEYKVRNMGLENNVKFINKYVKLEELFQYLKATDVYICSALNTDQIVSGTLAYAMGCGCAVVATPFLHAKDILTPERGILLDEFRKPELISKAVIKILSNPKLKQNLRKNAYSYTRHMTWNNVALAYKNVFEKYIPMSEENNIALKN